MHPSVLYRVCHGQSLPLSTTKSNSFIFRPSLLKRHRRHRILQADYPAVTPNEKSTVRGMLVSGLTDGDIWRLDIFEGDEYERRKVKVRVIDDEGDVNVEPTEEQLGNEVEAETYIWTAGTEHLEDSEWDFKEFVRDKLSRWAGCGAEESGEYNGENIRPSILGWSLKPYAFIEYGSMQYTNTFIEVDQAVKAAEGGRDPTGGRSLDGNLSKAVEDSRVTEVLKSAV